MRAAVPYPTWSASVEVESSMPSLLNRVLWRLSYRTTSTSLKRAVRSSAMLLTRVGDKWSLYIVDSLAGGPMCFMGLKRTINDISQRMLTLTLKGLEKDGLVSRTMFSTIPPRVDYELTPL
jgi:DNA-binding HxlR family transcriptional regulator